VRDDDSIRDFCLLRKWQGFYNRGLKGAKNGKLLTAILSGAGQLCAATGGDVAAGVQESLAAGRFGCGHHRDVDYGLAQPEGVREHHDAGQEKQGDGGENDAPLAPFPQAYRQGAGLCSICLTGKLMVLNSLWLLGVRASPFSADVSRSSKDIGTHRNLKSKLGHHQRIKPLEHHRRWCDTFFETFI